MMKLGMILLATLLIPTANLAASPTARSLLTEKQMRALALAGVKARVPAALKMRGFELDREKGAGAYVYFMAMVDVGEGNEGFYVVDARTGDMWDGVSECGEITSPEIRHLQHQFRRKRHLSPAKYARIKRRGPMCDQLTK